MIFYVYVERGKYVKKFLEIHCILIIASEVCFSYTQLFILKQIHHSDLKIYVFKETKISKFSIQIYIAVQYYRNNLVHFWSIFIHIYHIVSLSILSYQSYHFKYRIPLETILWIYNLVPMRSF